MKIKLRDFFRGVLFTSQLALAYMQPQIFLSIVLGGFVGMVLLLLVTFVVDQEFEASEK